MREARNSKKILIATGGTGGHIIPAISISKELQKRGIEILFVGNKNSMEENLVKNEAIDFRAIDVQKLYREFTFSHIKFPFKLLKSISDSKKIIREFKPDAFLGTGGFVSGPVGYAAHLKNIPIFLQEQNSFPGLTTRKLSKYAQKIFLGNAGAAKHLKTDKLVVSGNPINSNVIIENKKIDFEKYRLKKDSFKIFLTGGSQGSVVLNKTLYPIIEDLISSNIEIIWQIGKYSFDEFYPEIKEIKGIFAFEFTNEIGKIYNSVDLVICRAGALTLAEIETKKIPSILVPLPSAAENHQYYNALELKNKKVAEIIQQKDLNPEVLKEKIFEMKEKYQEMRENFGESKHLDSAKIIAEEIISNLKEK